VVVQAQAHQTSPALTLATYDKGVFSFRSAINFLCEYLWIVVPLIIWLTDWLTGASSGGQIPTKYPACQILFSLQILSSAPKIVSALGPTQIPAMQLGWAADGFALKNRADRVLKLSYAKYCKMWWWWVSGKDYSTVCTVHGNKYFKKIPKTGTM
jgi:hypothetical protein